MFKKLFGKNQQSDDSYKDVKQQVPKSGNQPKTTIMMHCFREPIGAEKYYEKFCNWAQAHSSNLIDPISVELGILLKNPINKETYGLLQGEIEEIRVGLRKLTNDLENDLWSSTICKGDPPKKMIAEVLGLSIKELIDNVPFCYVVALEYGNNKLPSEIIVTESWSDSYGTVSRLNDYISRRWIIDRSSYGASELHQLFNKNLFDKQSRNQNSSNITIFTFVLHLAYFEYFKLDPNLGRGSGSAITMSDLQKEKMANSIRKRVGIPVADVKVFVDSEWDAPKIKTYEQSEVAQNYATIQQGMKKILQKHGVPVAELEALTREVDGAPNRNGGFLTFWIIYEGNLSSPSEQNKAPGEVAPLSSSRSQENKQIAEQSTPLSNIPKEHWKGLNVIVYGIPDYDRKGVCLGHAVGVGGMDLAEVLFEGESTTQKYSPKFVELIGLLPEKESESSENTIKKPIISPGENLMSNETTITQYLQQLGAPATPFTNAQGATGLRFTTATYMGLQVSVQLLNDQILMLQFGIGYPLPTNIELLFRQLLFFNAGMIGVYFCMLNDNAIMLRSSRMLEGIDFTEFKQSIDMICNAFMQNGMQVVRTFQLSSQPLQ